MTHPFQLTIPSSVWRRSLAAVFFAAAISAQAQTASQTVPLVAGWNAVWLEVEPFHPAGGANAGLAKAPADVFTNAAVDIVATPKPLAGSAEFFGSEPGSISGTTNFNREDWQQWKRTDIAGANNLTMVFGNRSYLIHTTAAANLTLSGRVRFFRPTWTADRFNLLGFGLDGTRTFAEFFGPSGTKHPVDKIFSLKADGTWVKVSTLPSQTMESNKAYWIYSSGMSNYMGPVAVDFPHAVTGVLDFGGPGDAVKVGNESLDLKEITVTNYGPAASPTSVLVQSVPSTGSSFDLFRVTPSPATLGYLRGNGFSAAFGTLGANQNATFTIGARRGWTDSVQRINLYRLRTGAAGASVYLPITAVLSDVQQTSLLTTGTPASPTTGLWVGDVVVNRATSIVVNGSPTQAAAGSAPLRLILHSETGGTVRLLSQVTLMQTKTANPEVPGVPVLVLDPAKVPFFEGIKIRGGKRVGVRVEAVAYDMPRSASAWSGADLVTFATRPPALKEEYDLSKPMSGSIGQTVTATIALDPFHRSNPLRHVYHQDLTKGPRITRTITVVFDSAQPLPDRLSGTFSDSIQGLIKDNLTLTGRVEMRRVSPVGTLEGQ